MRRTAGFTLIELVIVLALAAILAAWTLPALQRHIARGKRVQAQAVLLQLMLQQERYYSQNNRYIAFSAASTDPDERRFTWWSGANAADSAYEIQGAACPGAAIDDCVRLSALPGTRRVDTGFRDSDCGALSLDSSGQRAAAGPAQRCWP